MMLFLIHQFTRELQSRADVLIAQVVTLAVLPRGSCHAAGQATYSDRNRCARAADDWLAVADGWVNGNSLIHRSFTARYARR
jgi:hypothetical protein